MSANYYTRGAWLQRAGIVLRSNVFCTGEDLWVVPRFSVSAYWPAWVKRYPDAVAATVSQENSATGFPHVCFRDELNDPWDILHYLAHEMIHVIDGGASGHRGQFARIHKSIGMVGQKTGSESGPELQRKFDYIADRLGPYPNDWTAV